MVGLKLGRECSVKLSWCGGSSAAQLWCVGPAEEACSPARQAQHSLIIANYQFGDLVSRIIKLLFRQKMFIVRLEVEDKLSRSVEGWLVDDAGDCRPRVAAAVQLHVRPRLPRPEQQHHDQPHQLPLHILHHVRPVLHIR